MSQLSSPLSGNENDFSKSKYQIAIPSLNWLRGVGVNTAFQVRTIGVLPFNVTWDKFDNLTELQFCHLQNGENNTCITGSWLLLNDVV